MAEQSMNDLYIMVDCTKSMGDAVKAVFQSIHILEKILNLIGFKLFVITFGDYQNKTDDIQNVISILNHSDILKYLHRDYPLMYGIDFPEASISAIYTFMNQFKMSPPRGTPFIMITDAPPHQETDLFTGVHASQLIVASQGEKRSMLKVGFPYKFPEVVQRVKDAMVKPYFICKYGEGTNAYEQFGRDTVKYLPSLNTNPVLIELLMIINKIITDCPAHLVINPDVEVFIREFQAFSLANPETLQHLTFLSGKYYKAIRSSRKFTDLHSRFMVSLIATRRVPQAIIDLFKNAQVEGISLEDILLEFPKEGQLCINYAGSSFTFANLKDYLTGNVTNATLRQLRTMAEGFKIISPENPAFSLPLSAINNNKCLLAGLACMKEGVLPEFENGILVMLSAAIIQWCEIPQILDIFTNILCSENSLTFFNRGSDRCVPDIYYHRMKLQFIVNAISKINRQNITQQQLGKINDNIRIIERLIKMIQILNLKDKYIPLLNVKTELKNFSRRLAVLKTKHINMCYDVLLQKWMVSSIIFFQTHRQVIEIVRNMREHNGFFQKTEEHFANIMQLSEMFGGLFLSIYSINCHITTDNSFEVHDGRYAGYQDAYAKNDFVSQRFIEANPIGHTFDEIKYFYENRVGVKGENILTVNNLVHRQDVLENGPQMLYCCKPTCTICYFRQDSSKMGLDDGNTRCGYCRKGVLELPMYQITCQQCKRGFSSGIEQPQGITPDACPYCNIPDITLNETNVSVFRILNENIEYFSKYFGIPAIILQKLLVRTSMAKVFRRQADDPETAEPLTPEMFQDHDWNDVKIVNPVLLLNGNTIQENSIDILLELLDNNFIIECAVCYESKKLKDTKQICQNQQCVSRFCMECVHSLVKFEPGQQITQGNLQCPCCCSPIKKGYFGESNVKQVKELFAANPERGKTIFELIKEKTIKVHLCSNFGNDDPLNLCPAKFPFEIDDRVQGCGAAFEGQDQELVEGMQAAAAAPQEHLCFECVCILQERQRLAAVPKDPIVAAGLEGPTISGHYSTSPDASGKKIYFRPCPGCNEMTENHAGCFHMTCGKQTCRIHYCWCCGEEFPPVDGFSRHPCYQHLRTCHMVPYMREHNNPGYYWVSTIYENGFDAQPNTDDEDEEDND